MRRSFHWKRLLIVLVVLVAVGGGLYALNRVQIRSQAGSLRVAAEKAEATIPDNPDHRAEAISRYTDYLKFQPGDEEAALKRVHLLFDQYKAEPTPAHAGETAQETDRFLRLFPDHPTERRKLAELYLSVGRVRLAREHLDVMFDSPKGDFRHDPEVLEMAALCDEVSGRSAQAIGLLEEAIKTGKAPVRIYQKALELLNKEKGDQLRESKIANHLRALKEKEPFVNNLEARIAVARFEMFRREFDSAARDIEYARTQIPGGAAHPDLLLAAAELEIAAIRTAADVKPRLAAARGIIEQAFKADPKNVAVGLFLADLLDKQSERQKAIEVLRETAKAYGSINDQYWVLIDYLLDLREPDLSASLVDRAAAGGKAVTLVGYFRGRLAVLAGDWMQAKTLLEDAAPNLVRMPAHHKRAMVGLGIVYDMLQNPDQELSSFRAALRDDGGYVTALIGEAEALAKLNRLDDAVARYQALVTTYQIEELRPTLVRLRLLDTLRKPPENRNWAKFDSEDNLGPQKGRSPEVAILQAQSLAARGDRETSLTVLRAVLAETKDRSPAMVSAAWVALARVQEAGKPDGALKVLEKAFEKVGDTVELRLARAEVLVFRDRPPTAAEFEALATGLDKFSPADRYRLSFGLGKAAINALPRVPAVDGGDADPRKAIRDAAIGFLRRAAEADPRDLHCRAVLIDLALTTDRKEYLEQAIEELAKLEGPGGPMATLARVSVRVQEVKKLPDAAAQLASIRELREMARKVQQQRPGWGRVYVALGRLDELEGLTDQAVDNYRRAINEGDRDESVIRKAVALYRDRKHDATAAAMLDELATKMILPEDLERFRAIYEMLNRTVPRSERPTIDRIAPAASIDSRIQLLRGSLLAAIREDAEALRAFKRAIELAGDSAETWKELIRQLVRTGDLTGARAALAQAEPKLRELPQKSEAARADLYIVLGECYELCGDPKTAADRYAEALRVAPQELNPNRRTVEFYMRSGRSKEAEDLLGRLVENPAQDLARWARRFLGAVLLISRPDAYNQRARALALIEKNLAAEPNDPQDIKAKAVIQTIDPASREDGIRTLKEYWTKGDLTPDESYHLGMLIFNQGKNRIPEAVTFFESAAKPRPGVTTEHLATLIRVYLALDKVEIAEATLERLRANAPYNWETTREEARILVKKSQAALLKGDRDDAKKLSDEALRLVKKFPGYDTADGIRLRSGPLLAELAFYPEAEALYQKLIALSDAPAAHAPLVVLYIQTKRTDDAIKLAQKHQDRCSVVLTAQLLSAAVRVKRPAQAVEEDVERWLNTKVRDYAGKPEFGGLLAARAELLDAQEKYSDAIAEYRRALQERSNDVTANNLAMLIALTDPRQVDEAIKLMSGVIDIRGPVPTFLDTRGVCYLVKGGAAIEKAVEDLQMARMQTARPVYAYHLAWAYDLQQKRIDRDRLLEEAKVLGIEEGDVHPRERDKYRALFGKESR